MNDEITQLKLAELRIHREWRAKQRALETEYQHKLWELEEKIRLAARDTGEIPCLVRWTQGPGQTVYHAAVGTCDRVQKPANFKELPESEAIAYTTWGLKRCTACAWESAAQEHAARVGS